MHNSLALQLNAQQVTPSQLAIVAIALLALVIDGLDIQLLSLVSPVILSEWNVNKANFGPALAAALVGMSFGASLGGWFGDRYGRKRVLVVAMFAFGTATIVGGLTQSVLQITVVRLISGFGFGAAAPNSIALASEWFPLRARSRVAALLSIGTPLGGIVGAMTVLQILPVLGWTGCFFVCGAITLLLGAVVLLVLPESPGFLAAHSRVEEARKAIRRVTGVDAAPTWPSEERAPTGSTTIFARSNLRVNWGASLTFFGFSFVAYAIITWTPVLLTTAGFQLSEALTATIAFNVAAVAAALVASSIIEKVGTRALLVGCSLGALLCIASIGVMLVDPGAHLQPLTKTIVTIAVGGTGGFTGAGLAAVYALLTFAYSTECRAAGIGFGMMMGRLGAIATVVSGGFFLSLGEGSPVPFLVVLASGAACAIAGIAIVDRHIAPTGA